MRCAPLGFALAAACIVALPLQAQTIAITGGMVHTVDGPAIEGGTVLIRGDSIVAVGRNVAVPDGATVIDARGKIVTPGLIHASSDLGLLEVGSISSTSERSSAGEVTPSFDVAEGINPASVRIPVARMEGVTSAVAVPSNGVLAGQASLVALDGDDLDTMLRHRKAAMVGDLGSDLQDYGGGSHAAGLGKLRQLFRDAQEYARRRADYQRRDMQDLSAPAAELEALLPMLRGEVPYYADANQARDIRNALRLAEEFDLQLIIRGGAEAWQVADELRAADVPVAVNAFANIPDFQSLGVRWDNATLLDSAGVTVVLYESETGGPRNLRYAAGHAVRNGMPWEHALRAVTRTPGELFGTTNGVGVLAPGRPADVVVWGGDPFEISTHADVVIIGGKETELRSRQTELLEKYRVLD
ncbi:MAG TPA: amidohydrolase family protein [Gemmatimonadales bacterium]|nr:amidohydrolase family protein [Gemmatimonadales bacterium]